MLLQLQRTLVFSQQVDNLGALSACWNLHTLDLGFTRCFDLAPLQACKKLRVLHLHKASLLDVSCLKSMGTAICRPSFMFCE